MRPTLASMCLTHQRKRAAQTIALAILVSAANVHATPRREVSRASTGGAGTVRSTGGNLELVATIGSVNSDSLAGGGLELVGGLILPILPTDCDEDGSVGYLDHRNLLGCLTGPAAPVGAECRCFDVDTSGAVDLRDFAALQRFFNNASPVPGEPDFTTVVGEVQVAGSGPIEGALVELMGYDRTVLSDAEGRFRFADVPTLPALIDVVATANIEGEEVFGGARFHKPFRGGVTDVGVITLSNIVRWVQPSDGLWTTDSNWEAFFAPGPGQPAIIDLPDTDVTVTHNIRMADGEAIASLFCNERLRLEFDSFSVSGIFEMNNTLEMACGLIEDTTIDLGPTGVISIVRHPCNSAVENVTINGNLDLVTDGAPLISRHSPLTINGDVRIGGFTGSAASGLYFFGANKVLNGNATISFTRNPSTSALAQSDQGLLHLTSGITIRGAMGRIGRLDQPLIHDGIIHSDTSGQLSVSGAAWINNGIARVSGAASELALLGNWTNNGAIEAFDGGTLFLGSAGEPFANLGTITATDATVRLEGEYSIADLGSFDFNSSEVIIGGTLINDAGLELDSDQFNWKLGRGTILGGVIDSADGTILRVVPISCCGTAALDGVTLNTDMQMTDPSLFVKIFNGLVLNGTLRINGHTTAVRMFAADKSIMGNGRIEFLSTSTTNPFMQGDGGTIHIGPGITMVGANVIVGTASTQGQAGSIINDGIIHASRTGFFIVAGVDWVNNGTMRMSGGATLRLDNDWTNQGTVAAGVGSLDITGSWVNHGEIHIAGGTVVESAANYTQSSAGTFVTTIANASGDGHGKMLITGSATLDGTLRIEFANGYTPVAGHSFPILFFASRAGEFDTVEVVGLDPGFQATPSYASSVFSIVIQ